MHVGYVVFGTRDMCRYIVIWIDIWEFDDWSGTETRRQRMTPIATLVRCAVFWLTRTNTMKNVFHTNNNYYRSFNTNNNHYYMFGDTILPKLKAVIPYDQSFHVVNRRSAIESLPRQLDIQSFWICVLSITIRHSFQRIPIRCQLINDPHSYCVRESTICKSNPLPRAHVCFHLIVRI